MTASPLVRLALLAATCAASSVTVAAQVGAWSDLGFSLAGSAGTPSLEATPARYGRMLNLHADNVAPLSLSVCVIGTQTIQAPVFGGTLVPDPIVVLNGTVSPATMQRYRLLLPDVCLTAPVELFAQVLVYDPAAPQGWAFSNAIWATVRDNIPSDFNGDGHSDLAVGVPREDVQGHVDAGAVNVIYGSASGLTQTGNVLLRPGKDVNGLLLGSPEAGAHYGTALASGDFNGDGFDDLAVGAPHDDLYGEVDSGRVFVIFGSAFGLQGGSVGPTDTWVEQTFSTGEVTEAGDNFGAAVAAGDYDGDGYDDLLVGAPGEDGFYTNHGIVHVIFGASWGFSGSSDHTTGAGDGARLGLSVLLADLDGDGLDEAVAGKPYEDVNGQSSAGAVAVIRRSFAGTSSFYDLHRDQFFAGFLVSESAQPGDLFGYSLAAADFARDGALDLVVGVPGDDVNGHSSAGSVQLFRNVLGSAEPVSDQVWHQDVPGVIGTVDDFDTFGYSVATYDHNLDGFPDLAIGAIHDRLLGTISTGAVNVLLASGSNGVTSVNDAMLTYTGLGLGTATSGMGFGWALTAGRFAGTCDDRLVIGIPDAEVNGVAAGSIAVVGGGLPEVEWSQGPLNGQVNSGDRFGAALSGGLGQ